MEDVRLFKHAFTKMSLFLSTSGTNPRNVSGLLLKTTWKLIKLVSKGGKIGRELVWLVFDGCNLFEVKMVEYLKLKRAFRKGDVDTMSDDIQP